MASFCLTFFWWFRGNESETSYSKKVLIPPLGSHYCFYDFLFRFFVDDLKDHLPVCINDANRDCSSWEHLASTTDVCFTALHEDNKSTVIITHFITSPASFFLGIILEAEILNIDYNSQTVYQTFLINTLTITVG